MGREPGQRGQRAATGATVILIKTMLLSGVERSDRNKWCREGESNLSRFAGVRARRRNPERAARVEGPIASESISKNLVPGGGVEPPRAEARRILSPPPNFSKHRHICIFAGL